MGLEIFWAVDSDLEKDLSKYFKHMTSLLKDFNHVLFSALLNNRATNLYFACVLDQLIGFVPSHIKVAK